jgi:hypothetical protein
MSWEPKPSCTCSPEAPRPLTASMLRGACSNSRGEKARVDSGEEGRQRERQEGG